MSRPLTRAMADALKTGRPFIVLCEIEHPDGTARFWTGVGKLVWKGLTFTGSGALGTITPVKQSTDISVQEINFILSGVDTTIAGELKSAVANLAGRAWMACLDDKEQVIPDPYQFVESQLDYQTLNVGEDGTTTIQITARMGFYTLDRGIEEAWTAENQKTVYPDDTGLDLISGLVNQDIQWKAVA